ncbi:MAG: extracellular solute-binding protein [Alphaproteobacteria bacterium]|nr:extracellular solute-binding protein [Alphaproteobacteria bacterium]
MTDRGTPKWRRRAALGLAVAAGLGLAAPARAQLEERLVIITSFSKDVTEPYAKAFMAAHPGVKVEILNRNTTAGVAYVRETRSNPPDVFWASAPDAFEVLKKGKLLEAYKPAAPGIAEKVGTFPINDPEGFFFGFAASGYGIMYNTRYVKANELPTPKEWADLKKPVYFGHIGISAPSRSGTTHLTVENILQAQGWEKGWATLLEIGGNLVQVSDRSFGVPDAVNSGQYGLGIVIDFFGLSAKASGFPVEFVYPGETAIVPANVGIIAGAKNPKAARAFIEFLLSDAGQKILLDPKISRLPVKPAMYANAPAGYPNPFKDTALGSRVSFDSLLSEGRYELVNSLYDRLVTFRLKELNAAWKAIHTAEAALAKKANAEGAKLVVEARRLASTVPINEADANNKDIAGAFQPVSKDKKPGQRQAEFEERWDAHAKKNYAEAKALADKAAAMAK